MTDLQAVGVEETGAAASRERLSPGRFAGLLRPLALLFALPRLSRSDPPAPRSRTPRRGEVLRLPAPETRLEADGPADRLDAVARWIGTPHGRGRIVPSAPAAGVRQEVRVWARSGKLTTRGIRIGRMLGAGLAGTVYEVEGDDGGTFVEKHYGEIPTSGAKKVGRWLTAAVFALFRQAPLSFRELPDSVIAIHLANRFIVQASTERFGCSITPPLLYTRYDARSGGYVQAFAHVEGRPLRPSARGLPLLGEASVLLPIMRSWRDFLAHELGFWGLARQVDPANVNAYSNLWITPERHVVLLDLVPGVPGFLEPRYLWWGLRRGEFAPFADAVDLACLARWVESHPPGALGRLRKDLDLLRLALERWQAGEPRLPSSPLRPVRVVTDPRVRAATRRALLTHLEVKGALSVSQAREYRAALLATGRFPKRRRHSILKLAPLGMHRAAVDGAYAWRLARRMPRLPGKLVRVVAAGGSRIGRRVSALILALVSHLTSHELRMRSYRARMGNWIDTERELGRLTQHQASRLRHDVNEDRDTADLAGLFVVHLSISVLKHSLFGPSALWFGLALAAETWWLALPAMIAPALRVVAAASMGFARRPGLLMLSVLPDVGVLAAPLYLIRRHPDLGTFIVRMLAQKLALSVPAFGQRGGLLEMGAVAAVQVLVIGPARILPWAVVAGLLAVLLEMWWAALAALLLYLAAVAWGLLGQPDGHDERAAARSGWRIGLPPGGHRNGHGRT